MKSAAVPIMGHLVAGFPDREKFTAACRAMADGGIEILELQLPFSDPTADGPLNTFAGETALRNGFRMRDLSSYLETAAAGGFAEVHIMTYANIIFRQGMTGFITALDEAGVTGIIVPDLPLEDEEGYYAFCSGKRIDALPVVVTGMGERRLQLLEKLAPQRCYAALRLGVTGEKTRIGAEQLAFLDALKVPMVYAGFGITGSGQISQLQGHAYAAVVGSYFTRIITETWLGAEGRKGASVIEALYEQVSAGVQALKSPELS
jgi:tryptophan synthase alpha chain